ncbi:senescence-specific cysteine protease SAG39-like [Bidens hawaiensis]|uniref:senescence-specific cysteine protease SAG39-like n=1 Tax=Bidens hawaiensis TaxID=980011 RepID=UPI004049BD62
MATSTLFNNFNYTIKLNIMCLSLNRSITLVIVVLVFITSTCHVSSRRSRVLNEETMLHKHEQWMARYGRVYKDPNEQEARFKIFKNNVAYIEEFNSQNQAYKLSVNKFADQTNEEFKAARNRLKVSSTRILAVQIASFRHEDVSDAPSSLDWRTKGAVTPVKDQGPCGSCWAFSTIAATEGIHEITTGKLISLSEQELMDCDTNSEDHGCEGGYMVNGFEFIVQNNGINTEAAYPYTGSDGTCNTKEEAIHVATISGYENVPANNESALLKAVVMQPVSVAVDASKFQFYGSGVLNGTCGTDLDHGVTVVGYGTSDDGMKYWLVKNSWGTDWGEAGYIRMQRDVEYKEGMCGIAMMASYPTA